MRAAARATRFAAEEEGDGSAVTSTREIAAGRHQTIEEEGTATGHHAHTQQQQQQQLEEHRASDKAAAVAAKAATARAAAAGGNIRALLQAEEVLAIAAVRHVSSQKSRVRRAKKELAHAYFEWECGAAADADGGGATSSPVRAMLDERSAKLEAEYAQLCEAKDACKQRVRDVRELATGVYACDGDANYGGGSSGGGVSSSGGGGSGGGGSGGGGGGGSGGAVQVAFSCPIAWKAPGFNP
jgi:uncharacterized membrane protein YgcG